MKKLLITVLILFLTSSITVFAQDSIVLKAGVSKINSVPKQFFGTWQVKSTLVTTDSPKNFKPSSADMWNLRRSGNVIELRNPMTGAVAEIYLNDVNNNDITFTHQEKEDNFKLTDTVKLHLNGNTFTGTNELTLTKKKIYGDQYEIVIKKAKYTIEGQKISGTSIY